ncbi:putative protein kinase CAMK-CAMKL-CHK1 family [Medicago truncatula]|uniref:Protein kinase domain-containing protein n=1 Tax=Medicago truncatula TaxID=3880 RepID=A0A396ILH3_MEDTR|nr:putative protein kinase CAMK-CAMKL-CHK1 family [Medicago truncatula]
MMIQTKREIATIGRVKHANVLRLYEVLATKTKIYLILQYAKGGDLFPQILKGNFNYNQARQYFQQLVSALEFCHKKGVYNRDLKPENLLLDENSVLKIVDFGFSTFIGSHRYNMLHTMSGTPMYVAPYVLRGKGCYGEKADNLMELYRKIHKGEYKCPPGFQLRYVDYYQRFSIPTLIVEYLTAKIMENHWLRKGLNLESVQIEREITNVAENV